MLGLQGVVTALRTRAEQTPANRERQVDLLRAWAICMVMIGHWLITAIEYRNGMISGQNALGVLTWSHPVTWVFQVMPVFFLVGGFSNAASLTSYLRKESGTTGWVLFRTGRLLPPATALLVAVPTAALMAVSLGVDKSLVGRAAWMVCMPLWFLLAYLAVMILTPWTHSLHRRFGLTVPVVLIGVVALGDLLRIGLDVPYVGDAGYLVAWLMIHQVGFFWHDGRLSARGRTGWAIAATGLVVLLLLTVAGPYEVLMVGANTDPPTLALLVLAATQVGVILALREPMNRWLANQRVWTGVVAVNAVILTVFLWHMTAALLTALLAYPAGVLPQPDITSGGWLPSRVPWLLACIVVLCVLVAVFGRIEMRSRAVSHDVADRMRAALVWTSLVVLLAGLLGIALAGSEYHGLGALPPFSVLGYLAAATMLRGLRHGKVSMWR